ncbi:replication protein A 70 kDa DNA-binding subunit B-like isoform X2 [Coffea arabica]|uniref:Replication protein A 70 kDa DNA-binding subunit B-like isoform X2 n=1 Tax=Coffea arabica TaxID=13443 RepID=A0ABM4UWW0_COFAR
MRGPIPTREIIIVDESSQPLVLTLWDEHEFDEGQQIADMIHTQPIIATLRIKATSYHTLNLSTKFATCILINPPTAQANALRTWSSKNQEAFLKFIAERTYADRLNLLPAPVDDRVVTIKSLTTTNTKRPCWIRGIPNLLDRSQKMWYNACPICYKYLRARSNLEFDCTSCHKSIRVSPRCIYSYAQLLSSNFII